MQNVKGIVKSNVKSIGKVLLSAFVMKKINSRIARGSGGRISKYVKLMLVGYLFKRLKVTNISLPKFEKEAEPVEMETKPVKEAKPVEKVEPNEKARGSLIMVTGKIIMGALAGATVIYAVKKLAAKSNWHKIHVH